MTSTSLPPQAPMANGTSTMVNGEADVSSSSSSSSSAPLPAAARSLQDVCALLHDQVSSFLAAKPEDEVTERTQAQTRISMQVIEKALQDYEFSTLSLSYNGGKDCLVLLILYLAVLHTHFSKSPKPQPKNGILHSAAAAASSPDFPKSIPSIYAKPPDPFPAVSDFVEYSSELYHLDLAHISTNPGPLKKERSHSDPPLSTGKPIVSFRDAFALYLSSHPRIQAIFVGTRRTDPHGLHLTHFDPTDHHWPRFMRVHPVIDWHLSEIWCFLRSPYLWDLGDDVAGGLLQHPQPQQNGVSSSAPRKPLRYCAMYDEGYTSLGGVDDTVRNPKLRYVGDDGRERYKPAYEMTWDEGERLGRE